MASAYVGTLARTAGVAVGWACGGCINGELASCSSCGLTCAKETFWLGGGCERSCAHKMDRRWSNSDLSAAFGGLAPVAAAVTPEIAAGDQFTSDQFAITVERALLIDTFSEAGAFADQDKGERVLAVQVEVENLWTEPQPSNGKGALTGVVRINDLELAGSTARYDDGTKSPLLQPGVKASVVLTWIINGDDFAEGDEITVTLNNMTLYTGSFVTSGQWWTDPTPGATVPLVLTDIGAGAEAEQ